VAGELLTSWTTKLLGGEVSRIQFVPPTTTQFLPFAIPKRVDRKADWAEGDHRCVSLHSSVFARSSGDDKAPVQHRTLVAIGTLDLVQEKVMQRRPLGLWPHVEAADFLLQEGDQLFTNLCNT
jgi:hypothetical protein